MTFAQDAIIIEPPGVHKASVICLHGLGADGHDFEPIVPEFGCSELGVRFIFPNAPVRPVTINGGVDMRAWYDIKSPDLSELEDQESIIESSAMIGFYIQTEIDSGITTDRIILAGFSQGGAIALYTGLRYPALLAGILVLSSYLPIPEKLTSEAVSHNQSIPIMMMHGIDDPVIPIAQGRYSCRILQEQGYLVKWNEYKMQHAVCFEEINAIGVWLKRILT